MAQPWHRQSHGTALRPAVGTRGEQHTSMAWDRRKRERGRRAARMCGDGAGRMCEVPTFLTQTAFKMRRGEDPRKLAHGQGTVSELKYAQRPLDCEKGRSSKGQGGPFDNNRYFRVCLSVSQLLKTCSDESFIPGTWLWDVVWVARGEVTCSLAQSPKMTRFASIEKTEKGPLPPP